MYNFYSYKFFVIILVKFIYFCVVYGEDPMVDVQDIPGDLITDLYSHYKDAVETDDTLSLRRLQKNDREFKIHVKKLKNVNGFKTHNLLIQEVKSAKNPIIYINNPVESKLPKTYLTLEEFKRALADRVKHQRDEFKYQKRFEFKSINKTVVITRDAFTTTTKLPRKKAKLKYLDTNKSISEYERVNETEATIIEITSKNTTGNNLENIVKSPPADESTVALTFPFLLHPKPNMTINATNNNFTLHNDTVSTLKLDFTMTYSKNESFDTTIENNNNFTLQSTTITANNDISTTIDPTSTIIDIVSYNNAITTPNIDLTMTDSNYEKIFNTITNDIDNFTLQSTTITPSSDISTIIDTTSTINDIVSYIETVTTSKLDVTDADSKTDEFSIKTNDGNDGSLRENRVETSSIMTTSSTIPRRSTLGRPLVFMGGYN